MTSPDCERMTKPPQKLSRSDSRPKNSFGNPYNAFQKLFLWSTIQYNTKHRVLKHNVTMYTHPQPRSVQMLSVAGSFPCSSYRNSHCYGGLATCVERCVPVASLYGRLSDGLLWQSWHSVLRSHLTGETYIPSDAIQSLHTVFPIVLKLRILQITSAGSFNCRFLVLSFSQVLTLNICYTLKQPAEIFAAFRTGSWKKRPKIQ